MVMVDRKIEGLNIDSVSINNELGGYLATKKLIESGHTEIGIVCGIKGLSNTTDRLSGYHRALREAGIEISQRFISYGNYVEEDRKSTRLNSSHVAISYAVFCLKKKK